MTFDFEDDVVIITGGTRGIGRGITKRFANEGATVVPTYHTNDEAAGETEAILSEYGVEFDIKRFDVAEYDAVEAAIDSIAEEFGPPTVLINNAGVVDANVLFRMEKEEWDRVMATNLDGAWNCTKVAIDHMRKQREGAIVNVSSVAGLSGFSTLSSYCASKSGLIGLTKAVASEYARRGIRSNAVAFGYVDTDLLRIDFDRLTEDEVLESIPQRRVPEPDEVAGVVAFLASDDANYVTGEVIRADGGQLS